MGLGSKNQVEPEYFTGSEDRDKAMFEQLSPEQKELYGQARRERREAVELYFKVAKAMSADPAFAAVVRANRKNHKKPGKPPGRAMP